MWMATERFVQLTSRWQLPAQLQHLLPGGRALEPRGQLRCFVRAEAPACLLTYGLSCNTPATLLVPPRQGVPATGAAEACAQA